MSNDQVNIQVTRVVGAAPSSDPELALVRIECLGENDKPIEITAAFPMQALKLRRYPSSAAPTSRCAPAAREPGSGNRGKRRNRGGMFGAVGRWRTRAERRVRLRLRLRRAAPKSERGCCLRWCLAPRRSFAVRRSRRCDPRYCALGRALNFLGRESHRVDRVHTRRLSSRTRARRSSMDIAASAAALGCRAG